MDQIKPRVNKMKYYAILRENTYRFNYSNSCANDLKLLHVV